VTGGGEWRAVLGSETRPTGWSRFPVIGSMGMFCLAAVVGVFTASGIVPPAPLLMRSIHLWRRAAFVRFVLILIGCDRKSDAARRMRTEAWSFYLMRPPMAGGALVAGHVSLFAAIAMTGLPPAVRVLSANC